MAQPTLNFRPENRATVGRQERGIMNRSGGFRTPERENLQNQTLLPHLRLLKNIENLESFLHRMPRESTVGQICQNTMLTSLKIILSHDFVFQPPMIASKH